MDKVVIITGASSGIGLCLANHLIKKGCTVVGVSRHKPDDFGGDYFECDLSNIAQINIVVQKIRQRYPSVDVLVNCAGIGTGGALEEISHEDTFLVFAVNVFGVMEFTSHLLPLLKQSKHAKIINIGSVAGEITIPFQVSYSMSKSSITRYSEGLRIELKPEGIDVMTILPGDTKTGFTSNRKIIVNQEGPYTKRLNRSINKMAKDEENGVSPMKVVSVIERMIHKKKMPVQKIVGFDYKVLVLLSKILPKRMIERIVMKLYG